MALGQTQASAGNIRAVTLPIACAIQFWNEYTLKRWVTEDNYKWKDQPKRKQEVCQERVKILGGATETI